VTDEELRSLKVGAEAESEITVEKEANTKKEEIKSVPNKGTLPNPYEVLK